MKKLISVILALAVLISTCTISAVSAYAQEDAAAEKTTVEERLAEIQQMSGFVPGQRAIITGNCYLFVAKVCEQLYGVTYNGEGLYDNYKSRHTSGNFYTVNEMITGDTLSEETVEEMKNFFLENAYPGDIVHYGSSNSGISSTHTFMIQSVDEEKITIYQANWERQDMSSNSCHVDEIYWENLVGATANDYNEDGSLYSMNAVFANRMRRGSIGISINRYSGYEELYNVPVEMSKTAAEMTEEVRARVHSVFMMDM